MKKTALLVLLALCVYSLAACSSDKAESVASAVSEAVETLDSSAASQAVESVSAAVSEAAESGTVDPDKINAIIEALTVVEPASLGTVNKLGDYKGIEVTGVEHTVIDDAEVESYIEENILVDYTSETTEPIQNGDIANIDYEGKKDGVAFEGGTAEGYDLEIGSGSFIDGFESGLIGKKAGETVDLNLKFPEDYSAEELAGKDVIFTVKINSVTRQSELTDAIAKEVDPESATAAKLREKIKKNLQESQDLSEKQELYYNAVSEIIENSDITTAQEAVDYTVNSYVKNYAESVSSAYGIDFGTMLSYYGMSYEDFVDSYKEYAVESVKQRIALQEIAKLENITVTEEDLKAFAEQYGYEVDEIKTQVGEKLVNELVLEEKANKFIIDNAKIVEDAE